MFTVTRELLQELTAQAQSSPRLRCNRNFHPGDSSACHRLLNAVEPASYIRPHRHLDVEKDEAFILLSGKLAVITFTDSGQVIDKTVLSVASGNLGVDLPHGIFHTALSLESGTVFFEAKAGPYLPLTDSELAAWAPAADTPQAHDYLQQLRSLFA